MGLEEIIRKIVSETETKVKEILTLAKEEKRNILAQAENAAQKIKEKMLKNGEEELGEKKQRQITLVKLEAQKTLLEEKQKIINEVYLGVKEKLENFSSQEYRKLLKELILKFATGGEEIIVAEKDKSKIDPDFLKDLNHELAKKDREPLSLSLVTRNIPGGFILRLRKLEINLSFPALIKFLREKTESQVVKILFGKGSP